MQKGMGRRLCRGGIVFGSTLLVGSALMGCRTENQVREVQEPATTVEQRVTPPVVEPTQGALVLQGVVFEIPDPELVDRPAELGGLKVTRVVSDKVFFVTDANQTGENPPELMVLLDEKPTPDTPTEGRYDVTAGQTLRVVKGQFKLLNDTALSAMELSEEQRKQAMSRSVYVHADQLEIQSNGKNAAKGQ